VTVCVFVNRGCDCGPVLNSRLISQLPSQFGPGSIRRVLRAAVQACVDCSPDQSTIYNLLREGTGRVVITGQCHVTTKNHHNRLGPFSGTTRVSRCQKRTSGLYGARED